MQNTNPISISGTNDRSQSEFISLTDLFIIIRQRWILALTAATVFTALFGIVLLNQTPQYEAEASLVVELSADKVVNVQEVVEEGLINTSLLETAMNTHRERLLSRSMAGKVMAELTEAQCNQLLGRELTDTLISDEHRERVLKMLIETVNVTWQTDSQILRVRVKHPEKSVAKVIANQYVKQYIDSQSLMRLESTEQAVNFLDAQTVELKQRLEQEEAALQSYRKENDLVTVEQNQQIITERLSDLSQAITKARIELLGVESYREQIRMAGQDLNKLINLPFIGGEENIADAYNELQSLKKEQLILAQTYLERHPRMLENFTGQEGALEALWRVIRHGSEEYTVEQNRLAGELASLEEELNAAKEESRRLESLAIGYRVLSRKVDAQRDIFDRVTSRFNETSISQQINSTTIRILDLAALPKEAVWPDKTKITLASVLLFGMIFLAVPFGIEIFDNRVRAFTDIENYSGKPILGHVLNYKTLSSLELSKLSRSDNILEREAWSAIYGALRLSLGNLKMPVSFVLTSSVSSEGKSIVAANLAATFVQHGRKTLLLDCDMRRPSQHMYHEIKNDRGLLRWINGDEELGDDLMQEATLGIKKLGVSAGYNLLTSGGTTKYPASIFESIRMDHLISRLKQEFDVLIFDTPPVGVFRDATLLADFADHCIFVARQHATSRQKTRHAISLMDRSNARVIGVIFNGVKNVNLATAYGDYEVNDSEMYDYQDENDNKIS
mgnify:CR=1 FL=1